MQFSLPNIRSGSNTILSAKEPSFTAHAAHISADAALANTDMNTIPMMLPRFRFLIIGIRVFRIMTRTITAKNCPTTSITASVPISLATNPAIILATNHMPNITPPIFSGIETFFSSKLLFPIYPTSQQISAIHIKRKLRICQVMSILSLSYLYIIHESYIYHQISRSDPTAP